MPGFSVERRLTSTTTRLKRARVELADVTTQLELARHDEDDARTAALVQGGTAKRESTAATRNAQRLQKVHDKLTAEVADLTRRQDELLDRLPSTPPSQARS
jgi:phage I-like protein